MNLLMPQMIVKPINAEVLHDWPLPMPDADGDKEERGRVLVIAGSREMPGAAWLAGVAALRAGAGKLAIATAASVAPALALALPEARVIGLPETAQGGLEPDGIDAIGTALERSDAVLLGPGMRDEAAVIGLAQRLLAHAGTHKLVLDAYAMSVLPAMLSQATALAQPPQPILPPSAREPRVLITPHAGEMAHLTGATKEAVCAQRAQAARIAAQRWNVIVALKGATTYIATPDGPTWRHEGGNTGLAVSGSGDTLAGIITGLAARGATLEQAGAWGVTLHAHAGEALAERFGPLGYLPSEIPAQVPALMHEFGMR